MSTGTLQRAGFIHVRCDACNDPNVWLRCDGCGRSTRFVMDAEQVRCDCGQTYGFATCLCSVEVPIAKLEAVDHDKGPAALAEWELDWGRIAGLALAVSVLAGAVAWALL
jgi:hypothetical protein